MTVSIQKTEAEKAISGYFADVAARLPGVAGVSDVRRAAIVRFDQAGLPHRRIESWKYTDLRNALKTAFPPASGASAGASGEMIDAALGPMASIESLRLVFVDGVFAAELSDAARLGEGVTFKPMAEALGEATFAEMHGKAIAAFDDATVGALNTAFMRDGAALHIAGNPAAPVHIVHVASGHEEAALTTRNVVFVGDGVAVTLIESFVALGDAAAQVNALTHLGIGAGAKVAHVKLQKENRASTHLSTWVLDLAGDADYRGFQFSSGAALSRNQIAVNYRGEGALADVSGCVLIRGTQHCDTTMVVDHAVAHCASRELFKLVLDDNARGVFQGKVIVRRDAQKTDGKQMAQALMLSESCEFDAKPELEIYADDVACGHGATCVEIDPDLVFYCRSRGIPEAEARALITESFVAEAMETLEDEAIAGALAETARAWLRSKA